METSSERVVPVNPTPFLKNLFGKKVVIKLKWGIEYAGTLSCADAYMNVQLTDVTEYMENEFSAHHQELLIRCNNILYIKQVDLEDNGKN